MDSALLSALLSSTQVAEAHTEAVSAVRAFIQLRMTAALPQPSNVELEQALIGSVIVYPDAFRLTDGIVSAEDFREPVHQEIWRVLSDSAASGGRFDLKLLISALGDTAQINLIKGSGHMTVAQYLARCGAEATSGMAWQYAQAVRDLSDQRRIGAIGAALRRENPEDPDKLAVDGIDALNDILSGRSKSQSARVTMAQALAGAVEATAKAYQTDGAPTGVPWMLDDLDRMTLGMQSGELLILAGRPGAGKDQPTDTPVLTPQGWRAIGDVNVGDFVMGISGLPTRVLAVHPQGVKQSYRVTFRDGSSTECGIGHLWSVASGGGRNRGVFRTKTAGELIAGRVCIPKSCGTRVGAKWYIPVAAPVHFPPMSLPIDPYVLGVLIGDGCTVNRNLRFSTPDMDRDIVVRMAARLAATEPSLRVVEGRSGACPQFDIRRREGRGPGGPARKFKDRIRALGLSVYSREKFIPVAYLFAAIEHRWELLRGLMDTDGGCIKNRTEFYSTSQKLRDDVAHLVRSLGGTAVSRETDRSHDNKPTEYELAIRLAECPFHTARKAQQWKPAAPVRYMRSIEPSRICDHVCITVEATDGLYITNDFIVTHNSAVAASCARQIAKQKRNVLLESLEMSATPLAHRIISDELYDRGHPVSYHRLRSGRIDPSEFDLVTQAARDMEQIPLTIDHRGGLTWSQIAAQARQMKRRGGLDLLIVDHLQLIQASGRYAGQRVREVGESTASAKMLAKELDIPVLMLCQLNRGIESRQDKRPVLSDLRESGEIEQDADVVVMVYRESYYLQQSEPTVGNEEHFAWQTKMEAAHNKCELIVAKQRNGPTGSVQIFLSVADNAVRNAADQSRLPGRV